MDESKAILAQIAPLKAKARERGHCMHCTYQDLWFTPDELDELNARGKFVWGPGNWTVRDPADHTKMLQARVDGADKELTRWRDRVGAYLQRKRPDKATED